MNKAIKTFIVCVLLTTICHTFDDGDIVVAQQECTIDLATFPKGTLFKVNKPKSDGSMTIQRGKFTKEIDVKKQESFAKLKSGDVVVANQECKRSGITIPAGTLCKVNEPSDGQMTVEGLDHNLEIKQMPFAESHSAFSLLNAGDVLQVRTKLNDGCALDVLDENGETIETKKCFVNGAWFQIYSADKISEGSVEITHADYYNQHTFLESSDIIENFKEFYIPSHLILDMYLVKETFEFDGKKFKKGQLCEVGEKVGERFVSTYIGNEWTDTKLPEDMSDSWFEEKFEILKKGEAIQRFPEDSPPTTQGSRAATLVDSKAVDPVPSNVPQPDPSPSDLSPPVESPKSDAKTADLPSGIASPGNLRHSQPAEPLDPPSSDSSAASLSVARSEHSPADVAALSRSSSESSAALSSGNKHGQPPSGSVASLPVHAEKLSMADAARVPPGTPLAAASGTVSLGQPSPSKRLGDGELKQTPSGTALSSPPRPPEKIPKESKEDPSSPSMQPVHSEEIPVHDTPLPVDPLDGASRAATLDRPPDDSSAASLSLTFVIGFAIAIVMAIN